MQSLDQFDQWNYNLCTSLLTTPLSVPLFHIHTLALNIYRLVWRLLFYASPLVSVRKLDHNKDFLWSADCLYHRLKRMSWWQGKKQKSRVASVSSSHSNKAVVKECQRVIRCSDTPQSQHLQGRDRWISVSVSPTRSTYYISGQPELHSESPSRKKGSSRESLSAENS